MVTTASASLSRTGCHATYAIYWAKGVPDRAAVESDGAPAVLIEGEIVSNRDAQSHFKDFRSAYDLLSAIESCASIYSDRDADRLMMHIEERALAVARARSRYSADVLAKAEVLRLWFFADCWMEVRRDDPSAEALRRFVEDVVGLLEAEPDRRRRDGGG